MKLIEFKTAGTAEVNEWQTVKEVAELMRVSKMTILRRLNEFETKIEKGLGGERVMIKASSLPLFAKMKLMQPESKTTSLHTETLDELPEKAREVALAKFDLIRLWQEFRSTTKLPLQKADDVFIYKYKMKEYPVIYKTLNGKGSVKTLYRDLRTLQENDNDFRSLAPGYSYGKEGVVLSAKEAEVLLKYIKFTQKLKVSEIVRWSIQELKEDGFINLRTAATYRRWVEGWKNKNYDEWILHREGKKALNDKVSFYTKRDKTLTEVGDLIIIDGHDLNFEILSPYPPYKPKRMTLVLCFDYRSDMPLGWEIMPTENKYTIASAVRRALIFLAYSCGIKDKALKGRIVNIDNGRANKSKYLLGEGTKKKWFTGDLKTENVTGLFEKVFEGVAIAKPYHGQTKTIERFFGTFSELERLSVTYSGTSIENKPPRMMRNEKLHRSVYEKLMTGVSMTIEQAHYLIARWFDEYANREHIDGYFKGYKPKDIFKESLEKVKAQPDFESRLLLKEQLNYLMLEETITTLYRRGIRFMNHEYFAPELYSYEKGKGKVNFKIKFDRENPDSVLVFNDKGNFVCTATEKQTLHPLAKFYGTPEQIQEYQDQLNMQRQLTQSTNASFKDHFENELLPQISGSVEKIKQIEETKLEKQGKLLRKVSNSDLDFSIDESEAKSCKDEIDLKI
jgi:putative transposase